MRAKSALSRTWPLLSTLLLAAVFVPLAGQQATTPAPAAPPSTGVKILHVNPADVDQVASLLNGLGVDVRVSQRLGLITVAGPQEALQRVETAINDIQIQRVMRNASQTDQNIELMIHFLGIVEDQSSAMPTASLRDVVAELKKTFPFGGYKLLETVVLRTRAGQRSEVSGLLPSQPGDGGRNNDGEPQMPPLKYTVTARIDRIDTRNNSSVISLSELHVGILVPVPVAGQAPGTFNYENVGMITALEVPDGKTVVVGKAGARGGTEGFLVVLSAKVVN